MPSLGFRRTTRRLYRTLLALIAMLSVSGVLLASVLFFLLQNLNQYLDELSARVGTLIGQPVSIGAANVYWHGANPILRLEDLRLLGGAPGRSIGFKAAEVRLDALESLRRRSLQAKGLRVLGARVSVARNADGRFELLGFGNVDEAGAADLSAATALLIGPARLTLSATELVYTDRRLNAPPVVLALDVGIDRGPNGQTVSGAVRLPGRSQSYITVEGVFAVAPTGRGWLADLRLRSNGISGRDVRALARNARVPGLDAVLRFDVRARLGEVRAPTLEGRISASGLVWTGQRTLSGPGSVTAQLRARLDPASWRVELTEIEVGGAVTAWTAERAALVAREASDGQPQRFTFSLERGRVEDLVAVLEFLEPDDADVRELADLAARGEIESLSTAWVAPAPSDDDDAPSPFAVIGRLSDVGWPHSADLWGIGGLDGQLTLNHRGGSVAVQARQLQLSAPDLAARALDFQTAAGDVQIAITADGMRFGARALELHGEGFTVLASGSVTDDGQADNVLDAALDIRDLKVKTLKTLLPSPQLSAAANDWVGKHLLGGTIQHAALSLKGRTGAIDVRTAPGALGAEVRFADLSVSLPGVPAWTLPNGSLNVKGKRLDALADDTLLGDFRTSVKAAIDDLTADDPALVADLRFTGPSEKLATLMGAAGTPVVGDYGEGLNLRGTVTGTARLTQRLVSGKTGRSVKLGFKDNTAAFQKGAPAFEKLSGELTLEGAEIKSSALEAELDGRPVAIDVALGGKAGAGKLSFDFRASPADMHKQVQRFGARDGPAPGLLRYLDGSSRWRMQIALDGERAPIWTVASDLDGVEVSLPAPLAKAAGSKRALTLSGRFEAGATVTVRYGDTLRAEIQPAAAGPPALSARFGRTGQLPPLTRGRWRVNGTVPLLDLSKFDPGEPTALPPLELDVAVGQAHLGSIRFRDLRVRADPTAQPPAIVVDGKQIAGRIRLPEGPDDSLHVELERLVLPALNAADEAAALDPREMPAFTFSTKQLVYDDRELGTLKLVMVKRRDGVSLEKMYLIANGFDAQGAATWTIDAAGRHATTLEAQVHADDFASLLDTVGYDRGITRGGATDLEVAAAWQTSPAAATLSNMAGTLQFHVGKGRLMNLAPGAGARVFGLLSLQALPTLLSLDFGRFFKKGFDFERIHGQFQVDAGQAYTNDLSLESESARITVAGRAGLVDEDYDQTVTVTPKLTDSLPVAGAAFGGVGAGVGAAIWLAEQILRTDIVDKVASFRYRVTGSWKAPVVERIQETVQTSTDG